MTPKKDLVEATDLFCGGGGSSTGLVQACQEVGKKTDLAAVNHWQKAVETHRANYPWARHFCQDIRNVKPKVAVPSGHLDILLAGAPCPHFSVARGGRPMDDHERSTPREIHRWLRDLDVDGGLVENVREFCFPKDTMVWTENGLVPIQDISVGMKVLTHKNRWRKVTSVFSKVSSTVIVKGTGGSVESTPNHRFYARKANSKCWRVSDKSSRHCREFSSPKWVPAEDLAPDNLTKSTYRRKYSVHSWASPTRFPIQKLPLLDGMNTDDFWRFVGFWLGDGWIRYRRGRADGVRVCANHKEKKLVKTWLLGIPWLTFNTQRHMQSVVVYETTSSTLASWLITHFNEYAGGKTIPSWVMSLPAKHKRSMIEGYTQADGHINKADQRIRAATISKRLALGFKALLDSIGLQANVTKFTPSKNPGFIKGRVVRQLHQAYCVNWKNSGSNFRIADGEHLWSVVRSVKPGRQKIKVYDIEVEGDHSFVADGFVVHNCTWGPLDKKGYMVRSRMGEFYQDFIRKIEGFGYDVESRVLNAADYGAATTRKRLFIMYRRKGKTLAWPEPTHADRQLSHWGPQKPAWRPARDVIDWSIQGRSIFNRPKPLSKNTIRRIAVGIERFCGDWAKPFLIMLYGTGKVRSVDLPLPTITAGGGKGGGHVALCQFLLQQQSGGVARDVSRPAPTIAASGAQALVDACLIPFYGERPGQVPRTHSLDEPVPTIPATGDGKFAKVDFLVQVNHGGGDSGRLHPVTEPLKTISSHNGFGLASFIVKYFGTGVPHGVGEPVPTVTAKDRFGLVQCGETTYGLDIRLRMLEPHELAAAMSFPKGYQFTGNRADKVRQIGNAWDCQLGKALCRSLLVS